MRAGDNSPNVTVREFLSWFGAHRRGQNVVLGIRDDLKKNDLVTDPDFEGAWIGGHIKFVLRSTVEGDAAHTKERSTPADTASNLENEDTASRIWVAKDPSHQISKLASANQDVLTVGPNETISRAVTKMLLHDFSQLPVSTGDRNLQGVISWKSIGNHHALGKSGSEVREAMEQAHEVRPDTSMFDVMGLIAQHDYVIVRSSDRKISGIVTATDLNEQFRDLSEPFLLLSEIENLLRNVIGDCFTLETLREVRDESHGRPINGLSDLTLGEYIRLLEKPERWDQLSLALDRAYFCEALNFVRQIRNEVMHFDPDGIETEQLRRLRETAGALRQLDKK